MNRTHRLARLLAPVALAGSIAAATPLAHAAPARHTSTVATQQVPLHTVSPDLSITICINDHCVTIHLF